MRITRIFLDVNKPSFAATSLSPSLALSLSLLLFLRHLRVPTHAQFVKYTHRHTHMPMFICMATLSHIYKTLPLLFRLCPTRPFLLDLGKLVNCATIENNKISSYCYVA